MLALAIFIIQILSRNTENIESFDSSFDFNYSDYEFNGAVTASIDMIMLKFLRMIFCLLT